MPHHLPSGFADGDTCTVCGCSRGAIERFGWLCRGESPSVPPKQAEPAAASTTPIEALIFRDEHGRQYRYERVYLDEGMQPRETPITSPNPPDDEPLSSDEEPESSDEEPESFDEQPDLFDEEPRRIIYPTLRRRSPSEERIHIEYVDPASFEYDYQCDSEDVTIVAIVAYHRQHRDDGTPESGLDLCHVTDCEWEQLRYNGGADSQYWDADEDF